MTPSWATVDHEATETADRLAVSDRPVLQALHLHREEQLPAAQEITVRFGAF